MYEEERLISCHSLVLGEHSPVALEPVMKLYITDEECGGVKLFTSGVCYKRKKGAGDPTILFEGLKTSHQLTS